MPTRLRVLLTLLALLATLQFSQAGVDSFPEEYLPQARELDNATEAVLSAEEPNEAVLSPDEEAYESDEPALPIHESDETALPIHESDEPTEPMLVPPEPAEPDKLPDSSDPPTSAHPKPTPGPRTAANGPRDPPLPDCGTPERPCLSRVRQ